LAEKISGGGLKTRLSYQRLLDAAGADLRDFVPVNPYIAAPAGNEYRNLNVGSAKQPIRLRCLLSPEMTLLK